MGFRSCALSGWPIPLMWPAPGRGARVGARKASAQGNQRETHVAETETGSAKLGQQALVTEIEKTRMELAKTIDAISDRVSQVDPLVGGAIALAAVSLTSYLIWRRLRR